MSLRLRLLLAASRVLVRPKIARASNPVPLRRLFDRIARRVFRAPPFTLVRDATLAPALPALIISNRPGSHPVRRRKVVLYFHGGGFVAGRPANFAAMLARIARLTRCEVIAPAYRLAPENPFPAAVADARAAWDALIARGCRPGDIVIGGDSAGGNLALGLLAALLGEGTRPAGLFAFSPVTDLTFSGASVTANAGRDAVLPAARRDDLLGFYLQGAAPDDPRASPLFARYPDPPPVLLQYAATEILADDSRRMAERLRAAGGAVTLDIWPDAPHVWVLFDGLLPEARQALLRVATFVNALFDGDQAGASAPEMR
jgi:epsilon-lactone hydrolase